MSLLENAEEIPARTILLSGTPSGTVFQGLSLPQKIRGALGWLFGGWGRPLSDHAIDAYIADARAARIYLQNGDTVHIHADHMGVITNEILP